jgi:hypothetical protein
MKLPEITPEVVDILCGEKFIRYCKGRGWEWTYHAWALAALLDGDLTETLETLRMMTDVSGDGGGYGCESHGAVDCPDCRKPEGEGK